MTTRQPVALDDLSCEITDFGSRLLSDLTGVEETDGSSHVS
jgi:hypothetical protein